MKKSNYREENTVLAKYNNCITAKLDKYEFEDLDTVRTSTYLCVDDGIEHFTIEVTITHDAPNKDVEKFFDIMKQDILPEYMEAFYNAKDFKVILFDESGRTESIVRCFDNETIKTEEISEEEEL